MKEGADRATEIPLFKSSGVAPKPDNRIQAVGQEECRSFPSQAMPGRESRETSPHVSPSSAVVLETEFELADGRPNYHGTSLSQVLAGVGRRNPCGNGHDILAIVVVCLQHVAANGHIEIKATFARPLCGFRRTRVLHF